VAGADACGSGVAVPDADADALPVAEAASLSAVPGVGVADADAVADVVVLGSSPLPSLVEPVDEGVVVPDALLDGEAVADGVSLTTCSLRRPRPLPPLSTSTASSGSGATATATAACHTLSLLSLFTVPLLRLMKPRG
jgi:hypothetical protein